MEGSIVILKRLGKKQYKAQSPCHLSNQKEVSLPLPTIVLMPILKIVVRSRILAQKDENRWEANPEESYLAIRMDFHLPDIVGSLNLNHNFANNAIL